MTIPILKTKVLAKPTIKGKMDVRFPANIITANFLTVTRANGTYTFGVDYTVLTAGPIADPTTAYIAINETIANWQALWLCAGFLGLAFILSRARDAPD